MKIKLADLAFMAVRQKITSRLLGEYDGSYFYECHDMLETSNILSSGATAISDKEEFEKAAHDPSVMEILILQNSGMKITDAKEVLRFTSGRKTIFLQQHQLAG